MSNNKEPRLLQVGDEIVRFEVERRIDCVYVIDSVTKTIAKSGHYTFLRETNDNTRKPDGLDEENQEMIISGVQQKGEKGWSTKYFYLIKKGTDPR